MVIFILRRKSVSLVVSQFVKITENCSNFVEGAQILVRALISRFSLVRAPSGATGISAPGGG